MADAAADIAASEIDAVQSVPRSLTRRRFLQVGACSAVVIYAACHRDRGETPTLVFFTAAEYATTAAACERILPRDEDPGAIDLGVPAYIDQALATDQARWAARFRAGLGALDREARRRSGKSYTEAPVAVQNNILDDWKDGSPEQAEMVRRLMTFTLEGAFGDPSHGGNRDARGWQLIGFAPCEPRHGGHHG
jgi:gluconate 2-dehydrogenase gamma chain